MSSALKPALPQGAGGQAGPAQNNSAMNSVAGAQTLNHNSLGHHNMAHLPHLGQNSSHLPGGFNSASGAKGLHPAPLSLVQEKPSNQPNSQPLALTRSPERDIDGAPDQPNRSNGTGESPKIEASNSATNVEAPVPPVLCSQPVPEEKDLPAELVLDKNNSDAKLPAADNPSTAAEAPSPDKPVPVETASIPEEQSKNNEPVIPETPKEPLEPSEKAEVKPDKPDSPHKNVDSINASEPKPDTEPPKIEEARAEDKAPSQEVASDSATVPEPAKVPEVKGKEEEKPAENNTDAKGESPAVETASSPAKPAENAKVSPAKELSPKTSPATPTQKKTEVKPKSTLKLATVTPTLSRKRKSDVKTPLQGTNEGPSLPKRTPKEKATPKGDSTPSLVDDLTPDSRSSKRNRTKVQPYQIPTPELTMLTKLSVTGRTTPTKQNDEKLIVFYKNEFLAVRNAEGSFYVCQTTQNVYRSTRKIKIRWLSQDKAADPSGETYNPDFYDTTDMDCVLTTLSLQRSRGSGFKLGAAELARTQSILGRALAAERGEPAPDTSVTEEHPDGLDLSLYKDESQLEKKKQKGSASTPPSRKRAAPPAASPSPTPSPTTPAKTSRGRTPLKGAKKAPKDKPPASSTPRPLAQSTSKVGMIKRIYRNTATPPAKASPVPSPAKRRTPAKVATPPPSTSKGKTPKVTPAKAAAAAKAAQLASTPSTSSGKTARTPRKPPSKK